MELTLDQALQKGIEAHKAGKVEEADRYYTAILKAQPKHPDANHNMGALAVGVGKVEAALPFFKIAVEANPSMVQFWLSYVGALIKLDRLDDARTVLNQAKSKGVKSEAFNRLENSLNKRPSAEGSKVENPPQDQLQPLISLYNQSQLKPALDQALRLLNEFPSSTLLHNICGAVNAGLQKYDEAVNAYKQAIIINPNYPDAYNNMGVALKEQGKFEEAIEAFKKAISIKPHYAEAHNNMGNALKDRSKLDEAIEAYTKALSIKPDYADACYNMGNALQDQGKLDEAIEAYTKALSIKPDYADACYNMGNALQDQGKLDEAIEAYTKALSFKPDFAEAHNNMGNALQDKGKLDEAIEAYTKALSFKPDFAEAHNNMGNALQDKGKLDEAIEAYTKALSIKPDYAEAHNNMGVTLKYQGKLDEAIEAYTKALSIKPDYAEAHNNMGNALKDLGKLDEAIEAYDEALSFKPDYAEAHRNLVSVKKYTENDKQFLQVQKLYKRDGLSEDSQCHLNFALAKMYEDLGKLDQAFRHLSEGNALRKKLLNYSINQDQVLFTKLKNAQPTLLKNKLEINESSSEVSPIFILGMPRSGTTLVEQMISSHSEVTGAGELNYVSQFGIKLAVGSLIASPENISKFRNIYLSRVSKLSNEKRFVTDKMPQNFRFIPLIYAAFPEAKIIHVQRNSKATCWSNYKKYFASDFLGYCHDLKDVADYYNLYKDLMMLWKSQYGDRIYNLNYENLTTDQENQTRKLLKHLELNWEDACLSPHKNNRSVRTASQQQVRRKVYKGSSEAWRKYEPYLEGAFDGLPSL